MVSTASSMTADEAMKAANCVCQRTQTGESVCVCDVPCASLCKDKTMEWMCECNLGGKLCQCKFKIQCTKTEAEGPEKERESYVCRCKRDDVDCLFQIQKCKCCLITESECGVCPGEGKTGVAEGQAKALLLASP